MRGLTPVLLLALAACAGGPPPAGTVPPTPARAPALDPAGVYDFETVAEGMSITGVITIARGGGGWEGTITTSATTPMTITAVRTEGQRIEVEGTSVEGALHVVMDLSGEAFTGTWTLGELSGTHTGRRRQP